MVYLIRGMQETNSVYVERVLSTSQMFHQLTSHQENVAGKHHCLVVKDIEDVIAKHRAEVTFASAESRTCYATLMSQYFIARKSHLF